MDFRIRDIDGNTRELISNIAKNKGITKTQFLRPIIREIEEDFHSKLKNPDIEIQAPGDEKIYGVSDAVVYRLEIVAKNLNVSLSSLLKIKLHEKIVQSPEHLKRKPLD